MGFTVAGVAALALAVIGAASAQKKKPNFLTVLADDLGFWDTQVHNPNSPTPAIGKLVKEGIVLDRHYVFRYCSPTRRAFLSGRFPNHITGTQAPTCSNYLPLQVTILSEKLKQAGYTNHFIGKGHLGYQTTDHLPINRGFDSHVGYLGGAESYSYGNGDPDPTKGSHDMWLNDGPGIDVVPLIYYSANFYSEQAVHVAEKHNASIPLWTHLALQNVHAPYINPPDWECHAFPEMWDETFANMLFLMDSAVSNVTQAWKSAGLWENTLMLFTADNGGIGPACNHPLRGHKHDAWEGGTRATAFIAGGLVPVPLQGTTNNVSLVHIIDWYATMSIFAGVDPRDDAVIFGIRQPIDSVDVWPMISGINTTQPRPYTPTSDYGLIWGKWKVVTLAGQSNYYSKNGSHVDGVQLPCLSGHQHSKGGTDSPVSGCPVCNSTLPCLFDIWADPTETTNLADENPDLVRELASKLNAFQAYGDLSSLNATELSKYTKLGDPHSTWRGYQGPCYVRGPAPPPNPSPPPAPPSPIRPCSNCSFELNVHYPGNDAYKYHDVPNATICCNLLGVHSGVVKFAYDTVSKRCTLKSAAGSRMEAAGFISGGCNDNDISVIPADHVLSSAGCNADEMCLNRSDGLFRCLEAPPGDMTGMACTLDYGYNTTGNCTCQSQPCVLLPPSSPNPNKIQVMVIGDSISMGYTPHLSSDLGAHYEVIHAPGNNGNTNWGRRCVDGWLGKMPSRWDVVTTNFGLHDLAFPDNEHVTQDTYKALLNEIFGQIDHRISRSSRMIWITTTPVPRAPNASCTLIPGRTEENVHLYNSAAKEVLDAWNSNHDRRIEVCDLHAVIDAHCGANYSSCDIAQCRGPHFSENGFKMLGHAVAMCIMS